MRKLSLVAAIFVLVLGIFINVSAQDIEPATSTIHDAQGNLIATAILIQLGGVVSIDIKNEVLPEGEYGVHIHSVGQCNGPDFTTSGGHFNPQGTEHGIDAADPQRGHAGDLPNMIVDANGMGSIQWVTDQLTLEPGLFNSVFDEDGSSIIIHANPDDMTSQPSGNSGPRIACGVISTLSSSPDSSQGTDQVHTPSGPFTFGMTELFLSLLGILVVVVILMRALG